MCKKALEMCHTCLILILLNHIYPCQSEEVYTVTNYKFHFPEDSGMGLYAALALPVDLPNTEVFFAYFYEAFYSLPFNETSFEYPPLLERRSYERSTIYTALENKISAAGFPGHTCLLRTICEVATASIRHPNGILGDLVHILLTPSSSKNDGNMTSYEEAERSGSQLQDCSKYNSCSISLLDLVSFFQEKTSL